MMKSLRVLIGLGVFAMVFAGPGGATEEGAKPVPRTGLAPVGDLPAPDVKELAAFKKEIRALYDLKEKAFAEGNADPIVDRFYAANAVSVGPEGKPAIGRDAFRKEYQEVVQNHTVKVESVYSYVKGDLGWDWANFHVASKDGKEAPFTFVILFLWAKSGGHWVSAGDAYVTGVLPEQK
jgi:ketosteroid isomerase-like protein